MRATLVFLIACGAPPTPVEKLPPSAQDLASCTLADDCTIVDACCGCSYGGQRVALRKDRVGEYDATRRSRCGDRQCPAVISNHGSCHGTATCAAGRCKVEPHGGTDAPIAIVPMPAPPTAKICRCVTTYTTTSSAGRPELRTSETTCRSGDCPIPCPGRAADATRTIRCD